MIWHFFEVWVLMLVAFAIGCPIGAIGYDLIARTRLAGVQNGLADRVGDVVDGIKSRLGVGPVWRPEYRRIIERAGSLHAQRPSDDLAEGPFATQRLALPEPTPRRAAVQADEAYDDPDRDERDAPRDDEVWADDTQQADSVEWEDAPLRPPLPALPSPDGIVAKRPAGLVAPRNGVPDDLQRIAGIGERNERRLNELGIFHFGQIAAWTPAEMRWVARQLAFPERVERDDWIGQATVLATGGETGFVKAADRRRARRRQAREGFVGDDRLDAFEDSAPEEADGYEEPVGEADIDDALAVDGIEDPENAGEFADPAPEDRR